MNALWNFFWPLVAAGPTIGAIAGAIGFRMPRAQIKERLADKPLTGPDLRKKRWIALAAGAVATVAATGLWAGPMGAADRFTQRVEHDARLTLDNYEMPQVTAHLHRQPLSRRLILSGTADYFQRSELIRIMGGIPGVREVRWSLDGGGLPLIVEAGAISILGFLLGLLLAYFVELRRRYNAQWNW